MFEKTNEINCDQKIPNENINSYEMGKKLIRNS